MKTTLTFDDDIADYLKEQCRLQDKPFEQVVNETLRRDMEASAPPKSIEDGGGDSKLPPFKVIPNHSGFAPGVDPLRIKDVLADMDLADYFRKELNFARDINDRA